MILQIAVDFADYSWIIGIALIFGLGFFLNSFIDGNINILFLIMLAINGVVVLASLLEEWTLILNMIFNVSMLIINHKKGSDE